MPYINKKAYAEYQRLMSLHNQGSLLTPDGIKFICEANNYDPTAIGKDILDALPRIESCCSHNSHNKDEDTQSPMIVSEFGDGNVLITPGCNGNRTEGYIILQNGKGTGTVGESSTDTFQRTDDDKILVFTNTESIDALIGQLEVLKGMLSNTVEIYKYEERKECNWTITILNK